MAKKIRVSAPGKIILSGEHAVVYGYPAILAAVDRRLTVEVEESKRKLDIVPAQATELVEYALEKIKERLKQEAGRRLKIKIDTQIPIGCGMGSSAAFAVATTAAIFKFFQRLWDLEEINQTAYEIEKGHHGNPSGGDNTISTYGGFLWYRKEAENFKVFSPLKAKKFPRFFIINAGKPMETTGEMVTLVKKRYFDSQTRMEKFFKEIETVTRKFLKSLLDEESYDLKELFRTNERLLEELGVVSKTTKKLIRAIENIGGAAKISGAGGIKGNSGVILAYHDNPEILRKFSQKENIDIMNVKLGEEGVRIEKDNI